jgi:hypothetical protein
VNSVVSFVDGRLRLVLVAIYGHHATTTAQFSAFTRAKQRTVIISSRSSDGVEHAQTDHRISRRWDGLVERRSPQAAQTPETDRTQPACIATVAR